MPNVSLPCRYARALSTGAGDFDICCGPWNRPTLLASLGPLRWQTSSFVNRAVKHPDESSTDSSTGRRRPAHAQNCVSMNQSIIQRLQPRFGSTYSGGHGGKGRCQHGLMVNLMMSGLPNAHGRPTLSRWASNPLYIGCRADAPWLTKRRNGLVSGAATGR